MMELGLLALGFFGMEVFSWAFHKYVMHGVLWPIHKTHHRRHNGYFEFNDVFSLFFGSIAVILITLGVKNLDYRFWVGSGITLYGLTYFILHDMIIHRRISTGKCPANYYLDALSRAHRDHHKSDRSEGSAPFGLLWVSRRYFKK